MRDAGLPPWPWGPTLREARRIQRIKQVCLAADLGVKPDTLAGWEHGRYSPSWRHAQQWARALGYEVVLWPRERGMERSKAA